MQAGGALGILVDLKDTLDREASSSISSRLRLQPPSCWQSWRSVPEADTLALPVFAPWDKQRRRFLLKIDGPLVVERTGDEEEDVRPYHPIVYLGGRNMCAVIPISGFLDSPPLEDAASRRASLDLLLDVI